MATGTYVNVEDLSPKTYDHVCDEACLQEGVLITQGCESAAIVISAFPADGYSIGDAEELRDLILKFNKEHFLSPTVL